MLLWTRPLEGARVLEICCHDGEFGAILAMGGAQVTSVDLCPDLVAQARRRIALNRLEGRMTAQVMSVHALDFPGDEFDFVFGKAALHHLDLEASRREILRVLKPGGFGVFAEPVSYSGALRALRRSVPVPISKDSPDERQLDERDIARFAQGFAAIEGVHFRLMNRLDRVVPRLHRLLGRLDRALLSASPSLHRYAGICVFRVRKAVLAAGAADPALEP
jgi:SAM-dependent methyltransferase